MSAQQAGSNGEASAGPPQGPPYAPQIWQFGSVPTIIPDIPISAAYLFFYFIGAIFHMTVFQLNRKHGHFFVMSTMTFGFCMCRLTTFTLRVSWAFYPYNVRLGIASNIFVAAGTPILYIINLIFAHRIIRAQHPKLGWSRPVGILARATVIAIVTALCLLIYAGIQQSFTLNANLHRITRDIQKAGTAFYSVIAFLPIPMIVIGLVLPRRIRTEKFGRGRFRTKIAVIITSSLLLVLRAVWGTTTTWLTPVPRIEPIPWYYTKPAFYTVQLLTELLVVYLYAFVRVDRRFYTPTGQRNSYLHLPMPPLPTELEYPQGSSVALLPQPPMAYQKHSSWSSVAPSTTSTVSPIRIYTEEELFSDAATLADTLRMSRTSMIMDEHRNSGKYTVKLIGDVETWETEYDSGRSAVTTREQTRDGTSHGAESRGKTNKVSFARLDDYRGKSRDSHSTRYSYAHSLLPTVDLKSV